MPEGIDVVIPTKGRALQLLGLLDNLRGTAPSANPVLVIDRGDEETWEVAKRKHCFGIACDGGYPQKANLGFKKTNARLVLIAGDDVVFHADWLEAALTAFLDDSVNVVAPNDASPAAGLNATFPIVRRSYVEEVGGAWDEPGRVYHEGYAHNFTDTELWELAKWRGCARYVPECVIEHMHPAWGKASVDATYENGGLSQEKWAHDEALFHERLKLWLG